MSSARPNACMTDFADLTLDFPLQLALKVRKEF